MSDALENQVHGPDGRALPASPGTPVGTTATLTVEVVSDAICPWCWIGKRRLERALSSPGDPFSLDLVWLWIELRKRFPGPQPSLGELAQGLGQIREFTWIDMSPFRHKFLDHPPVSA